MFTDHFSFSRGLDLITRQPQVILLWVCLVLYLQSLNFNNFPLSKVIRDCIASVLLCSERKLDPFLSPIRSKTKTEWWLGHSHFTALPESFSQPLVIHFPFVLTGSHNNISFGFSTIDQIVLYFKGLHIYITYSKITILRLQHKLQNYRTTILDCKVKCVKVVSSNFLSIFNFTDWYHRLYPSHNSRIETDYLVNDMLFWFMSNL